jgi:aminopeptidase N
MRIVIVFLMAAIANVYAFDVDQWQSSSSALQSEAESKYRIATLQMAANAEATQNQSEYDAVHYLLDLFPDVSQKMLFGDVTMTAKVLSAKLEKAELNFRDNMQVKSVFFNGNSATFTHADDIITVNFGQSLSVDQLFTVRVVYQGDPAQSGFGAFAFDSYAGKPMVWTLSEPYGARNWWPCKDIPADKADSMDIKVTVRSDLIVASNGSLRSVVESEGKKTFWWHEQYPMTTYLASLAIYPYFTYSDWYVHSDNDSMEVQFYIFPNHVSAAKPGNDKTVSMITAFSEIFGEYPFIEEKYGHAEFLWGGGMEHQTITSLGGFGEGLIAHELAHQWWGDMVTCEDFHHIWLNEGFATYSEALWWEYNYGEEALHYDMAFNTYFGNETIFVENPYVDNIFDYSTTYQKASWVLHMLRHVVGDDVFFEILHSYYQEFKFKTINTEQFRDLCENVSGVDLDQFFDQWIYEGGAPSYEWLWQTTPTDVGWRVSGYVKQIQSFGPVFHMPIDLTVTTDGGEHTFIIQNTQQSQDFDFLVAEEPRTVKLDKDKWILAKVQQIQQPEFVVQNIIFSDEEGNTKNAFAPGETGHIAFQAQNKGVTASGVQVMLQSNDASINVVKGSSVHDQVVTGASFENKNQAFEFNIVPTASNHLAQLQLVFKSEQGADQVRTIHLPVGEPTLLFVDDDEGADYEKYYNDMATRKNIFADFWSIKDQGAVDAQLLMNYPAVLWFTGDARDSTLTQEDQVAIQNYISSGGHLVLTGQNIGFDLALNGDKTDSLFYANVLSAEFIEDAISDESVVGVPGDPLGNMIAGRFNDVYFGAHNQDSRDAFKPLNSAVGAFLYLPSSSTAGLRWHDSGTDGRIVYLGFGLEGIAGPKASTAAEFLEKIITWFNPVSGINSGASAITPSAFELRQNYPNPFNPNTTLQFYAPEAGQIDAAVFNVRGQKIKAIGQMDIAPGWHSINWDGKSDNSIKAASGVYFFSIRYNSENIFETNSVKMLKIE